MPLDTLRWWPWPHIAGFVLIVEHQIAAVKTQPNPARIVAVTRISDDLKSQNIPVEHERSGHIKYLNQGCHALDLDTHFNKRRVQFLP